MRILVLCTDSFGGHGGIALFNRELAHALAAHPRCDEVVMLPRIIPHEPQPIPDRVRFVSASARGTRAYLAEVRRAARERFDLVICGHANLLPLARIAARDPLLITHGIEAWKPLRDPLSRRLVHRCRAVVSVSELTRDRFLRWSRFAGRTFVLPNCVRLEQYGMRAPAPEMVARCRTEGKRVLLTVGRVVGAERYKGFDEVLEVLPQLPPDIVYVIAGGGDDAPRLSRKAADLGVSHRVRITGLFPDAEKSAIYSIADAYVMPSRGEGFGIVFLEAMASGVPVIASSLDGGREAVLDGRLGTLVDPTNLAEIRAAIVDALTTGRREVPSGLKHFAFPEFARRFHAIVDSVVV